MCNCVHVVWVPRSVYKLEQSIDITVSIVLSQDISVGLDSHLCIKQQHKDRCSVALFLHLIRLNNLITQFLLNQ